jgi:hypothetical protein
MAETITRAEACRQQAEQCEHTATLAIDSEAKRIYTELARQWREMVERAEVLECWLAEKRDLYRVTSF